MVYLMYQTVSREGKRSRRLGQYEGLEQLDKELSQHGEELVDYYLLSDSVGRFLETLRGKPKPLEIAEFCTTLSYYVAGGVEIQGALADAAESANSNAMRIAIVDIKRHLQAGYPLSESMSMTKRFPDIVINMTRIGEESGNLASLLQDAGLHIERVQAIKSAAKSSLIYPVFTLLIFAAMGTFWMAVVVPKIVELFEAMQVELESATLMLIAMSKFFNANWPYMLLVVIAIPLAWILARRNARFRVFSDHGLWKLPLFGRIVRGSQLAYYFQYLSVMYGAGVVITNALDTMQKTVTNKYFAENVSTLLSDLKSGQMLGQAFKQCDVFPLLDQRMVSIGEQTGNLEEQLQKLADLHFKKVQALVELLPKFIEPILLLVLGCGFAFFIVALIGPLYSMLSTVGGM